jgi:hypothetical protein
MTSVIIPHINSATPRFFARMWRVASIPVDHPLDQEFLFGCGVGSVYHGLEKISDSSCCKRRERVARGAPGRVDSLHKME